MPGVEVEATNTGGDESAALRLLICAANRVHRVVKLHPCDESGLQRPAVHSRCKLRPTPAQSLSSQAMQLRRVSLLATSSRQCSPWSAMTLHRPYLLESSMFITRLARVQTSRLQQFARFCNNPCPSQAVLSFSHFTSHHAFAHAYINCRYAASRTQPFPP